MSEDFDKTAQGKSTMDGVENENSVPVPSPVPESPSCMLKLDADCFEELFEWLSLADLLKLRRTCKRLQKVVDYFIKSNYPAVKIGYGKIEIYDDDFEVFQCYEPISLKMIRELNIYYYNNNLTKDSIDIFKLILPQIERLDIDVLAFEGDFYELILKWCTNLNHLSVKIGSSNQIIGVDNQWLLRHYPSIKHIELRDDFDYHDDQAGELKIFFELNPHVQVFSTTNTFLWGNINLFAESNIKVDQLNVMFECDSLEDAEDLSRLLKLLYKQGFYKTVHVCWYYIDNQRNMSQIASVPGMETLHLSEIIRLDLVSRMPNIRELILLNNGENIENLESMAKNLLNLKRAYFRSTDINGIISFLRHFPRLKEIKVHNLWIRPRFENNILDLAVMNKERSKLAGAAKVAIYVPEMVFLATKFAKTNIDLSLVTLKRAETVEWTHQFES